MAPLVTPFTMFGRQQTASGALSGGASGETECSNYCKWSWGTDEVVFSESLVWSTTLFFTDGHQVRSRKRGLKVDACRGAKCLGLRDSEIVLGPSPSRLGYTQLLRSTSINNGSISTFDRCIGACTSSKEHLVCKLQLLPLI